MIVCYRITIPRNTPFESQRSLQFMDQLLYAFGSLIFRIAAVPHRIEWQILDLNQRQPGAVESAIRASYPDAQVQVEELNPYRLTDAPIYRWHIKYQYTAPLFVAPIQHVTDIHEPDPLSSLVQSMDPLLPGEQIIYTLIVVGGADFAYKEGEKLVTRKVYDGSLLSLIFPGKADRYTPELQRVMEDKLQTRLYQALLTIQIDTPDPTRFEALSVIDNQTVHFTRPHFNGIIWYDEKVSNPTVLIDTDEADLRHSALGLFMTLADPQQQTTFLKQLKQATRLILEPRELATLWHLPHHGFVTPTINWTKAAQVELPTILKGKRRGVCLGDNHYRGRTEAAYLPQEDRETHCLIVGKTGTGKSNLLHQLIHQDIQQRRGVMVIDPHGDLVRDILESSVPPHREQEVMVLDLANEEYPLPLNPLRGLAGEIALARVVNILFHLYSDLHTMPQTADALENGLMTLRGCMERDIMG
jgi:Helicase HerA, central domain